MGGRYGKCVKSGKEVASYYYEGSYTTDVSISALICYHLYLIQQGCFRSCYQDQVKKACKCMDSRYPMPDKEIVCELPDRKWNRAVQCRIDCPGKCVETVTAKGDVSTWAKCVCPLPCHNSQFDSSYTVAPFVRNVSEVEELLWKFAASQPNKCNTYTSIQRINNTRCDDLDGEMDYVIINVQVPRIVINIFEETPAWTVCSERVHWQVLISAQSNNR